MKHTPLIAKAYVSDGGSMKLSHVFVNLYVEDGKLYDAFSTHPQFDGGGCVTSSCFLRVETKRILSDLGVDEGFYARYDSSSSEWVPVDEETVKGLIEL